MGDRPSQPGLAKGRGEQRGSSLPIALSGLALVSLLKPQRDAFSCLATLGSLVFQSSPLSNEDNCARGNGKKKGKQE